MEKVETFFFAQLQAGRRNSYKQSVANGYAVSFSMPKKGKEKMPIMFTATCVYVRQLMCRDFARN